MKGTYLVVTLFYSHFACSVFKSAKSYWSSYTTKQIITIIHYKQICNSLIPGKSSLWQDMILYFQLRANNEVGRSLFLMYTYLHHTLDETFSSQMPKIWENKFVISRIICSVYVMPNNGLSKHLACSVI